MSIEPSGDFTASRIFSVLPHSKGKTNLIGMGNRAEDWLDQAKDDLRWGKASAESQFFSHIPTRYPDAQPAGAPFRFFTAAQAEEALELAGRFILKAESEVLGNA